MQAESVVALERAADPTIRKWERLTILAILPVLAVCTGRAHSTCSRVSERIFTTRSRERTVRSILAVQSGSAGVSYSESARPTRAAGRTHLAHASSRAVNPVSPVCTCESVSMWSTRERGRTVLGGCSVVEAFVVLLNKGVTLREKVSRRRNGERGARTWGPCTCTKRCDSTRLEC